MNKNIFAILISLLLFSCTKVEPPVEESGYISAFVNGNEWKSETYNNPHVQIDNRVAEKDVVWKLPNWMSPASSCIFYISMYRSITPGKYNFNNTGTSIPSKGVAVLIQGWLKSGNIINYYSTSGYLEITYSDNVYMEGTFTLTAKDDSNNTLEFTNGKFKAYITAEIS
jgi:hypothetical protein